MTNMGNKNETPSKKKASSSSDDGIDELVSQISKKLQVNDDIDAPEELKDVACMIANGSVKKIVVLSGAGVSVAAGIPDFRTPGTGLYDNLQAYNLPYAEAVFDVNFYRKNPRPFCTLAKEIWPGLTHSPTLTHSFLKLLSDHNILLRNYSQNIDGLEYLAQLPAEKLVECHGHFRTASCVSCYHKADGDKIRDTILKGDIPTCSKCKHGKVKPDIVFFGESLPDRFHSLLQDDVESADLLFVMGTSLQVAPVSLIPQMVNCPRVLFNRDLVMDLNEGDVWVPGNCDDAVEKLCELLGWWDMLKKQNKLTRIAVKEKKMSKDKADGDKKNGAKE
jgi:NAD-dependent SIR2 family protein deacetylase